MVKLLKDLECPICEEAQGYEIDGKNYVCEGCGSQVYSYFWVIHNDLLKHEEFVKQAHSIINRTEEILKASYYDPKLLKDIQEIKKIDI